jgi:outer membrane lipoprotein-sorting protein
MPYIPTMPKNRILPALGIATLIPLVSWAQAPSGGNFPGAGIAPTAKEAPTEAETQIDAAVKQLAALESVSADLVQKVDMLDQTFELKGRYLKAPDHRVYLRLTVTGLADAEGTLLQVCDGKTLWDYKKILDAQSYGKFEIDKILEKLKSPDLDPTLRDRVNSQLGFSGPEELLVGLRSSVKFDQKESSTLDGRDVWVYRGEWRNRNALLGAKQQPLPATTALPAYYPSLVVLYVGKQDGWPYKLTLVGRKPSVLLDKSKNAAEARRLASQEVQPTRIELIYSNVVLNPKLNLDEFAFQPPPNAPVDDQTAAIVQGLEQAIAYQAAQKKAEAAKSELPTLDKALEVPRPTDNPGIPTIPDTLPTGKATAPAGAGTPPR